MTKNTVAPPPTISRAKRAVIATSIGNALEWYDFSVFAFFAVYISHSFFADGNEISSLIKSLLVFGVGFIARPLGALLLGAYGDRCGRKAMLTLTIGLMGAGTLIIAIAPPLWMIGAGAPVLLLIGRLLQGFSAGGEIGGATAFLVEHAPQNKRATYAAWLQASMGISNILAALMGLVITSLFTEPEIRAWAWRLPFIVGLLILPVGFYIRATLDESPEYQQKWANGRQDRENSRLLSHLFTVFRQYPKKITQGVMFSILWTVSVYTLIIYMPIYYASPKIGLGFSFNDAFTASLIGNFFMVVGCLTAGYLADRIGYKKWSLISIGAMVTTLYPLLSLLHYSPNILTLILVHTLFCCLVASFAGLAPFTLSHLFSVEVRTTGMAVSYNIAAIFFAGFTPALMAWATTYYVMAPALYVILASCITLIAILWIYNGQTNLATAQTNNKVDPLPFAETVQANPLSPRSKS